MLKGRKIAQNCYVVKNIDRAIDFWSETFNVGPFFLGEIAPKPYLIYQGRPAGMKGRIAFSYMGDLQLEMIEQTNDSSSIY